MKFFLSFKNNNPLKYLIFVGIVAAYLLGFTAKAYSPIHIGRHALPIPRIIPVTPLKTAPAASTGPVTAASGGQANLPGTAPASLNFNHTNIITTYFWVGEPADGDNGYIANKASAWDEQWQDHYGGVDSPTPRSGYFPGGFTARENPFYFALPYNDIAPNGSRKSTATNCPLANPGLNYSWCKNAWIAIRHGGKVAYAQWQDVGPFLENDFDYVLGSASPKNNQGSKAGIDVSPAVKDFLGLSDVDRTDWSFLGAVQVPSGPWKQVITKNPGGSVN